MTLPLQSRGRALNSLGKKLANYIEQNDLFVPVALVACIVSLALACFIAVYTVSVLRMASMESVPVPMSASLGTLLILSSSSPYVSVGRRNAPCSKSEVSRASGSTSSLYCSKDRQSLGQYVHFC